MQPARTAPTSTKSRRLRAIIALATVGVAAAACAGVAAASSDAALPIPTLALRTVVHHSSAVRYEGDSDVYIESGVYVASQGGAVEFDAARAPDGTARVDQVSRDSSGRVHVLRTVPLPGKLSFTDGLPKFFQVSVTDASGAMVLDKALPFCPSGYDMARTDTSGPTTPTYPDQCGTDLTQATVWGIDRGWATGLTMDLPGDKLPDGSYTLRLDVTPSYARALEIPADRSGTTLALDVSTQNCDERGCFPAGVGVARRAAITDATARPAVAHRAEGPQVASTGPTTGPGAGSGTGANPTGGSGGLPDMRALPAHDLSISREAGKDYLNFAATIWNGGSGPLEMEGFRQGDSEVMPATQFIYRDGAPVRSKVVGSFEFDTRPGHDHWHMEDIAEYDLLDASGRRVVLSDKQSFCLAPTDPIDLTARGALWHVDSVGLWSACDGESAAWLREVLPAGWGDTYYQDVAGQSFGLTGLPNGTYQVRVTTDPEHRLMETDYSNNVGLLTITLGGTPGHRTVVTA